MARIYCYDGDCGYSADQLLWVIAVEVAMDELGIDDVSAALSIVLGANIISTRQKMRGAIVGTSVISLVMRRLLKDRRFPNGKRLPTIVGYRPPKIKYTKSVGGFIARAIPVAGWAYTAAQLGVVGYKTVTTYNSIVDSADQVF